MGDQAPSVDTEVTPNDFIEVEVLEDNWETVQVFKSCSWVVHVLMDGKILHQDITSAEIYTTARLLGYPRSNFLRIFTGIKRIMVPAAVEYLNNRNGKDSDYPIRPPRK